MVCSSYLTPCVLKANQRGIVHARCGVGLKLRTVWTRTHKGTFELDSGAGELYDLVHDPEEMVNRFDDPGSMKIRRESVL